MGIRGAKINLILRKNISEKTRKERLYKEMSGIKNSLKQLITRVDLVESRITNIEHKNF